MRFYAYTRARNDDEEEDDAVVNVGAPVSRFRGDPQHPARTVGPLAPQVRLN